MKSQLDKLNDLWWDCISLLFEHNPRIQSAHSDRCGYKLSEDIRRSIDCDYAELINDDDEWLLIDDGGYEYDITTLSTDILCQLTDLLIEEKKGK